MSLWKSVFGNGQRLSVELYCLFATVPVLDMVGQLLDCLSHGRMPSERRTPANCEGLPKMFFCIHNIAHLPQQSGIVTQDKPCHWMIITKLPANYSQNLLVKCFGF